MALKSVFLIRHAESLEDVDPTLHVVKDEQVSLTYQGKAQLLNLGETWAVRFASWDHLAVYLSPSKRVMESWDILSLYFPKPQTIEVDARIRNLNWGNTNMENRSQIEAERYKAGVLNYQFPGGDNSPEYVRKINKLVKKAVSTRKDETAPEHIVIVTHGFPLRIIARYLLQISDAEFKWLRNPPNGYCLEITYDIEKDRFVTTTPLLRMKPLE